jgi:Rieske Fe-S protein
MQRLPLGVGQVVALVVGDQVDDRAFRQRRRLIKDEANQVEAGPVNDPELMERAFKILRFGAEPVILVRAGEGDFRAFTATCTHLDCIVEFRRQQGVIFCNCHSGVFDLTGRNVAGPPPRPLTPFRVHVVPPAGAGQPATLVVERA